MEQLPLNNNRKPYIEMYLPFYSVLALYKVGPLPLSTIGLMFVLFLMAHDNHGKIRARRDNRYLVFLGYVVIRDIIRMLLGHDAIQTQLNRIMEYSIVYVLVLIVCSEGFNEDRLYKSWKIAGLLYSIGLVYQLIFVYIFGQRVGPISLIPGYSIGTNEYLLKVSRPSSFFTEPASFANAMIPLEFMALRRRDMRVATIVSLIILSSTSTVGIILSVILWVATLLRKETKTRTKVIAISSLAVIVFFFLNLSIFNESLSKLIQVVEGGSTFGSRVMTGFEIVKAQSLPELIIGTEYNELSSFIRDHSILFSRESIVRLYWNNGQGDVFINTFSQIIFRYGIVGLLLFVLPLINYVKSKTYSAKAFSIMVIAAIFGQSMLLNSYYFMVIMILLLFEHNKAQEVIIK